MVPKEFVIYIDHQALRYLENQSRLNQRHMKWVEFMHSYTFVLKHRSRKSNKVADALSRRSYLLSTMTMEVTRLEGMKDLYEFGLDFAESWKACKDPWRCNKTPYLDYFIQEGFLFKNH